MVIRTRVLVAGCLLVLFVGASQLHAGLIWSQFDSPELTQEIMDLCYGGDEPPNMEIDDCGCDAAGWTWTGDDCINPG